jgi:hypothetical protein
LVSFFIGFFCCCCFVFWVFVWFSSWVWLHILISLIDMLIESLSIFYSRCPILMALICWPYRKPFTLLALQSAGQRSGAPLRNSQIHRCMWVEPVPLTDFLTVATPWGKAWGRKLSLSMLQQEPPPNRSSLIAKCFLRVRTDLDSQWEKRKPPLAFS